MNPVIYSIGHSTLDTDSFVRLLRAHGITAIADVRSQPYSRMNPQYNRETLARTLKGLEVSYAFLGDHLGARPADRGCYDNGRVSYERLASTHAFQHGITRVLEGSVDYRIAMMCAEKDPIGCHRAILVSRHLSERGARVEHILSDGQLESQDHLMARLKSLLKIGPPDMFNTEHDLDINAYRLQGERIAYEERQVSEQDRAADAG